MRVGAQQMFARIVDNKLLSHDDLAEIRKEAPKFAKSYRAGAPLCLPIGPAPAHYGDSPLKLDLIAPLPPM